MIDPPAAGVVPPECAALYSDRIDFVAAGLGLDRMTPEGSRPGDRPGPEQDQAQAGVREPDGGVGIDEQPRGDAAQLTLPRLAS